MDDSQERLIKYLDGELDSSEQAELEAQLESNDELKTELERLQKLRSAINLSGARALRKELDEYLQDYKEEEDEDEDEDDELEGKSSPRIWYAVTALAAAIILLALFNPFKTENEIPLQPQIDLAPTRADSANFNNEVKSQTDSLKDENDSQEQ